MHLTITPQGQRTALEAGDDITFTLLTSTTPEQVEPEQLWPDDIRLNGEVAVAFTNLW
ncbi:hypothetical protein [Streptantibioticus ferralitis]|uniref:Uncharacterized protein n=1 Tax=Streptantibioticus ferralitis TaxID=236510 RepID=A0ABT5Z4Y9_9ACTN|nr:hypothetical protein [Streptantibioticus ferralitis]MDF2258897.1 hypothetical protein [Streptantibioticus ferralitis]